MSNVDIDLQHHHVDGQDFYTETKLDWEHNGVCLCGIIHRDYHYNFLPKHSKIAECFSDYAFDLSSTDLPTTDDNDPDLAIGGPEVSRYTFLEYLKFLICDIKKNNSQYVDSLNKKMVESYGSSAKLTLEQLYLPTVGRKL